MIRRLSHLHFAVAALIAVGACSDDDNGSDPVATCQSDEDCGEADRCDDAGECVPRDVCASDDDCEDPKRQCNLELGACELRPGFGDECDADRPCEFGFFCSQLLGLCLDASTSRDCVRRSQCPSGQICDRSANACIPNPGCFGPEYCEPGETCDEVSRTCEIDVSRPCSACNADGQCDGGLVCDDASQACVPSGGDSPCLPGEFCGVLGACVECQTNADCGDNLFCNISLGRCESNIQCADEPSECPASPDVECLICDAPRVCNRRTQRCEAPPEPCEFDADCVEGERCDFAQSPPICVLLPPTCLNDVFDEEADNGSPARATPIESDQLDDLALCPGDEDWYAIDVEAGTIVTFDARFRHVEGDVELQLFLEDGRTLVASGRSATDNERIRVELGTDRSLRLRVFLARPVPAAVPYRLLLTAEDGEVCVDDELEPNDGRAEATDIDGAVDGRVCPADPDWFRISNVPAGSVVDVDLDFITNLGDLDLDVFRPNEPEPLISSENRNQTESISFPAPFGGDFFVRVRGVGTDRNDYTLRPRIRVGDPNAACLDDGFEPNDSSATSATISFPFEAPLTLCAGDEDLFSIPFPGAGGVVAVELSHPPGVDIDAALYPDADDILLETPLASGRALGSREFFAFSSFTAQDLVLRVFGATPRDIQNYELRVVLEDSFICEPDFFDAAGLGGSVADPADVGLAPTREDDLTMCSPNDSDFYRVLLLGGFRYEARLHWRRPNTALTLRAFDVNGNAFPDGGTPSANSFVRGFTLPGVGIAELTLQPQIAAGFSTDYTLVIDAFPLVDCGPDAFDPNESPAAARALTAFPFAATDLSLCPNTRDPLTDRGDEDWYELELEPGDRLEAEIRHQQGDLLLEVLQGDGATRACPNVGEQRCFSDGFDGTERVAFTTTSTGTFFLRVSSVYSAPGVPRPAEVDARYDLDVDVSAP